MRIGIGLEEWYPVFIVEELSQGEAGYEVADDLGTRYNQAVEEFVRVQKELARAFGREDLAIELPTHE